MAWAAQVGRVVGRAAVGVARAGAGAGRVLGGVEGARGMVEAARGWEVGVGVMGGWAGRVVAEGG